MSIVCEGWRLCINSSPQADREPLFALLGAIMYLLIAYTFLTFAAMLWICRDWETIHIFDVYGKSFHYVWFESRKRWEHLFTYGWRLVVVCLLVALNGLIAYRIYATNPWSMSPDLQLTLFTVMLVLAFTPIPWIYWAHHLRCSVCALVASTSLFHGTMLE